MKGARNDQTNTYEEQLKEVVIRYNLRDEMIFLNLNDENTSFSSFGAFAPVAA